MTLQKARIKYYVWSSHRLAQWRFNAHETSYFCYWISLRNCYHMTNTSFVLVKSHGSHQASGYSSYAHSSNIINTINTINRYRHCQAKSCMTFLLWTQTPPERRWTHTRIERPVIRRTRHLPTPVYAQQTQFWWWVDTAEHQSPHPSTLGGGGESPHRPPENQRSFTPASAGSRRHYLREGLNKSQVQIQTVFDYLHLWLRWSGFQLWMLYLNCFYGKP